ncbi:MAG TPA: ThuA domain-containing protein, partial [Candidatus Limnocylindrales bacterium]|nr:ThuA domain-containing protein [Candidatus Limnocylindrales bacterium]
FRENDPRLRPILAIDPASGGTVTERTVAWAIERAGGGRSFGFTGGHFFANWRLVDFRRLVLNAIVWSAGVNVPEGGVQSEIEEPIRALILTGHNHPAHEWRSVTAALLGVLEQDPRVAVEVTEEPEDLAGPRLQTYGLLVLNYSNWDRPGLSAAAKEGLLKYLAGGGGLAVIHFANGAFNHTLPARESDWEEYRTRIVRRVWMHGDGGSGHDAFAPFRVEITSLRHPITQGLQPFDTEDELYFEQKGDLRIEPLATARSRVTGRDEPMAWAYEYGKARVFQTVLGHSDVSVRKAGALIRRGSVWASGRPQMSFDPPPGLVEGLLFRDGAQWSPRKSKEAEGRKPDRRQGNAAPQGEKSSSAGSDRKSALVDDRPGPTLAAPPAGVLPPNPGLDGGAGGHWGLKGDADWVDARIAAMDYGQFLSSSLETPSGTVAKAISIRLGDRGEAAVCFDSGARSLVCGWTGGFLELSSRRFGLIEMPRIAGSVVFSAPPGPGWAGGAGHYRGLHVNGRRVVLEHIADGARVLESPWVEEALGIRAITRTLEMGPSSRPRALHALQVKGGARLLPDSTGSFAVLEEEDGRVTAMAIRGCPGARIEPAEGARLDVAIPACASATRLKLLLWRGRRDALPAVRALAAESPEPEDLAALLRPGPPRWGAPVETRGVLGAGEGPYVIDTLAVPHENPHRALLYLSGHDFFSNGDAAISTVHGDVWTVSGIDARLEKLAWRRFATGLYQPLGLRIVEDEVHVLGRDQITRLHDLDRDGEADFYECFSNDSETSPAGHDYHTCLETDAEGRFHYLSPRGLHRVSRDGRTQETIASGWRNPNGLALGPDGTITVAPQEGEWTPASQICEVK